MAGGEISKSIDVLHDTLFLVIGLLDEEAVVLNGRGIVLGVGGGQKQKANERAESKKQDTTHERTFDVEYEIQFQFRL